MTGPALGPAAADPSRRPRGPGWRWERGVPRPVRRYGLIRIPNSTTADCPGPSVPMVAVMVPAAPFAGVAMPPTVVEPATVPEYVVFGGVASLTTTLLTVAVPTLVTVIWYRRQAPGTAPTVRLARV